MRDFEKTPDDVPEAKMFLKQKIIDDVPYYLSERRVCKSSLATFKSELERTITKLEQFEMKEEQTQHEVKELFD